jgi:transcriptional regulator with XRE-family HTH domain
MDLSTRIRKARAAALPEKLSMRALARLIGVSHSTIGHWETARNNPRPENLEKAAKKTGVTSSWLQTGRGPRELTSDELKQVGGGFTSPLFGTWTSSGFDMDWSPFTHAAMQPA